MKKTPTLFRRDPLDRSRVVDIVNPEAQWVADGDGWPTRKLDGTCCMISGGSLWKRRELKKGVAAPEDFRVGDYDLTTGKTVGWVPVGDGPGDARHREAFEDLMRLSDGTYELVGPKVQGNPENYDAHTLVPHSSETLLLSPDLPRTFLGLRAWFEAEPFIEGVVWHNRNGQMAKIKLRDFGFVRRPHD